MEVVDIKVSEIIQKIFKMFDLRSEQCIIIGSAILYELGILNDIIRDIDIVIDPISWEKLSQDHKVINVRYGKSVIVKIETIEVEFLNCVGPPEFLFTTKEWVVSNGVRFITLENLITFYRLLDRPKDHIRIKLIENYLLQRRCKI